MRNWIGLALLMGLTACDQTQAPSTAIPPPSFWRVEIVEDSGGQTGAVEVCANPEIFAAFSRAEPRIAGQPCEPYGKPATDTPTDYTGRCEANGQRYGLYVSTKGDRASDFTVRFALQPLQADIGTVVQARRYHRLGACPAGWKAGDQAKIGGGPASNLLAPKVQPAR
ncbi:hypothetical protein [Caulobacter sp. FWC2]|uniref:hypothetical protein n=1 Tax=Caulobacter sp. FWC2 TaxID=69664 RepID=UPI000C15ECE2|nr:hypothetical protein [Caulobacter sp. FWC2]PIB93340.1 hypothetical protein CSW62_18175 [Caulobacter sp. FWC2]